MKIYVLLNDKGEGIKTFYKEDKKLFKKFNEQGWGVFFAVNDFEASEKEMKKAGKSTMRNIEFLKQINYVFADLDIGKKGDGQTREQKEIKKENLEYDLFDICPPSVVIETSNGIQPLWKLKHSNTSKEYQKRYVNVINAIIEWSKKHGAMGDKVKDVTRILRMPNYYHMKEDPYLVLAKYEDVDGRFTKTLEEFEDIFLDYLPKKTEVPQVKSYKKGLTIREIDSLDFQELTIRAFAFVGRQAEFDKQGRLMLDGRLTGTFQGKNGDRNYLASTSHEPFKGNRVTVVADILGINTKEAFLWIKDQYCLTEKKLQTKEIAEKVIENTNTLNLENEINKNVKVFTWGTEQLNKNITPIQSNHFILLSGTTGSGKTAFSFDVAYKNAKEGKKVLYLSLEMTRDEILIRTARSYAGITKEEWRNRKQIPVHKKEAYKKKIRELIEVKNVILKGFPSGTPPTIEAIFEIIKQINPDLTFLDNFDLIDKDKTKSEYESQTDIATKIMNKCHDENIPIVVIHHKNTKTKISGIGGNRGSGKIGDHCNISLDCSRTWDKDASDKDNAKFMVTHDKDRDFGGYQVVIVYFQEGTFTDDWIEPRAIEFWQDKF